MTRLIDADAFYKAQKERCGDNVPFVGTCSADNSMLYLELKKAPTIEAVEVRHGHWIKHKWAEESYDGLISNYECSECHSWFREWGHYCSDCGAKMDGEPI